MLDISTETLIPLARVPKAVPSRHPGKVVNVSTVWRWATSGCRGIRLETVTIGGGRFTSKEALQRFTERLSQPRTTDGGGPPTAVGYRTAARRQRDSERAGRKLEELGA